ncbi:magnesium and cobalt transport protein CorA [Cellulomonas sp. McL0617]|uniref:magnesium and cobalt transport protein CorA n=1 Tax=Cellulomonas sp. McL0617 TaxID=3415675 RepID=UPI003CE8983F
MIVDCALYAGGRRLHRLDDLQVAMREAEKEDGFVWIGLHDPTQEEFDALTVAFELPELAIEDAVASHQRPKLDRYGDLTFAVVKPVFYVDHVEVVEVSELAIFVGARFVIVVRHGVTTIPAQVREALEGDPEMLQHGPAAVLHGILDKAVDQYLDVTAAIEVDLDEIEDQVFGDDPGSDHAERIYKLKREVQQFRRAVVPLVGPLTRLADETVPNIPAYARPYFRDVQDHALHAAELVEAADTLLTNVMQADLAQVSMEQNRVGIQQNSDMRKISSWAAIAIVPTAIAGIYGMNFDAIPWMHAPHGFSVVLGVIVVVCVGLWTAFRRNKWL